MFCTNCGQENKDDSNFCKKCGNPLESIDDSKIPNNKKSSNVNRKILIIPIATIVIIFLLIILTSGSNLSNDYIKIDAISEHTSFNSAGTNALIEMNFEALKDLSHIKSISIKNLEYTYSDGSKSNENVNESNISLLLDGSGDDQYIEYEDSLTGTHYIAAYNIIIYTNVEDNKFHKHIKCDIIAHTALDGDVLLTHVDNDIKSE